VSPSRKEELCHRFLYTVHCTLYTVHNTSLNAPICQEDSYIELITLPSLWKSPLVPLTLLSHRKYTLLLNPPYPSFSVLHPSSSLPKPSTPSPLYESLPLSLSPYYPVANTPSFSNPSFSVLYPSSSLPKPSTPSPLYESLPLSLSPYYPIANTPSFSILLTLPSPSFTHLLLSLNPQHPPLFMKVSPCPSHPIIPSQTLPPSQTSLPFLLRPSPIFFSS
jgi:hypothetical protein